MMKTAVMMIGEFEYDTIFFSHDVSYNSTTVGQLDAGAMLPYKHITIVFFLVFMIIMPIIIMNLLVSI